MTDIKFYKVGGCVRDELLGLKPKDIDFAVEAPSYDAMRDFMVERGYKIYVETPQYLTIRAKSPIGEDADFVLCRKDGEYSDGRRPDSVTPGTLMDDLVRRDFTINAMARDLDGTLIDPFGGHEDVAFSRIRCVGDPRDRFREDSLRMLRAVRFSITKGFRIDLDIWDVLDDPEFAAMLANVSVERRREELLKMFKHNTLATFNLLNECSREFQEAVFADGLWLMPTMKG